MEKKERERSRNALIARRIQTVWEILFEKCLGNKTKANRKDVVWSSGLVFALLEHSTCVAITVSWVPDPSETKHKEKSLT